MTKMDPRLAARRQAVLEERARSGARRVVWLMVLVAVAGAAIWVLQSPWLSVREIVVTGAEHANVDDALAEAGVELGQPLVRSPAGAARRVLLEDPWVAAAEVDRLFPDVVEVRIVEHEPVLVLQAGTTSVLVSQDGHALTQGDPPEYPRIVLNLPVPTSGALIDDDRVVGAAEFFTALPANLHQGAVIEEIDGELWLSLEAVNVDVRLGRAIEMAQKAAAVQAVLSDGQIDGVVINVIAPTRPTVRPADDAIEPPRSDSPTTSTVGEPSSED